MHRQSQKTQSGQRIGASKLVFAFATHGLAAVIGFVTVPLYLNFMGAEAYGIVGFYVAVQGWMLLLDAGLAPMLSRQLAMATADVQRREDAAKLLKAAETLYFLVGLAMAAGFWITANWISGYWLGSANLPESEIVGCVRVLGLLVAARWLCVLYHAALIGLERQGALNAIILSATTLRAGVSLILMAFVSAAPTVFFLTQAALTFAEVAACLAVLAGAIPVNRLKVKPDWRRLRGEFRFAGALAVASAVWVATAQVDKLALSHFLPLREFGLFSLVAAIASGLFMITPPLTQMISPRLTAIHSLGARPDFLQLYRLSGSLMAVIAFSTAGVIALHPALVLFAWTGAHQSAQLADVLRLYALGTGCAMWLMIPYLLQYASGSLRLHVAGHLLFGVGWLPAAVLASKSWGAVGAGAVWLIGNLGYLALWTPLVHRRFLSRAERSDIVGGWLVRTLVLMGVAAALLLPPLQGLQRGGAMIALGAMGAGVFSAGILIFPDLRAYAQMALRGYHASWRDA